MAEKKKTTKRIRQGKASSGMKRVSSARKALRRLRVKLDRFRRYNDEIEEGKRSRLKRFKTDGIVAEMKRQQELVDRGRKIYNPQQRVKAQEEEQEWRACRDEDGWSMGILSVCDLPNED